MGILFSVEINQIYFGMKVEFLSQLTHTKGKEKKMLQLSLLFSSPWRKFFNHHHRRRLPRLSSHDESARAKKWKFLMLSCSLLHTKRKKRRKVLMKSTAGRKNISNNTKDRQEDVENENETPISLFLIPLHHPITLFRQVRLCRANQLPPRQDVWFHTPSQVPKMWLQKNSSFIHYIFHLPILSSSLMVIKQFGWKGQKLTR